MGEVQVPADALWGAQTQRAVQNFPISGERIDPGLIAALALIKGAAAVVNGQLGVLDPDGAGPSTTPPPWSPGATTTTSSRSTCSRPAPARRAT